MSVKPRSWFGCGIEGPIDAEGHVAFDASADFLVGQTFSMSSFHILTSFGVMGHPRYRDHVQCAVQRPVTAPVLIFAPVRTSAMSFCCRPKWLVRGL
jgi:hypothetical protein